MPAKSKKATAGSGSIRKKTVLKGDKKYTYWEGRATTGIDHDGKQRRQSVYAPTARECQQKLAEINVEVSRGDYIPPDKTTVSEWARVWLNTYTTGVCEGTLHKYTYDVEHYILPGLGTIRLQALQRGTIQNLVNEWAKTLAPKTIRDILGILHQILAEAVEDNLIRKNPCTRIKRPKVPKKDFDALPDIEDVTRLIEALASRRIGTACELDIYTGLREGELLGLSWGQIKWSRKVLHVDRQLTYDRTHTTIRFIKRPKDEEIRDVPLTEDALCLLKAQKKRVEQMRREAGKDWIERGLVFPGENGDYLSRSSFYNAFKSLTKKIGMEDMTVHDLRHVYAMLALSAGVDVSSVQHALGHATADFTLRVYAYVNDSTRKEAAAKMQSAFAQLHAAAVETIG